MLKINDIPVNGQLPDRDALEGKQPESSDGRKTLAIVYIYCANTAWTDTEVRNKNRIGQVPADQGKYRKPSAMGAPEKAAGYGLYTQMASDCTICKIMPKPMVI